MKESSVSMPEVPGVTHRFIDADGVRLHIAEAGDSTKQPVLLLHGFPQHWYVWRHVIPLMARDHHLIAVDLRGSGWSEAPRTGYTGLQLADDVIALLDELGLEHVDVIGHDWGAWIGFILGLRNPSGPRSRPMKRPRSSALCAVTTQPSDDPLSAAVPHCGHQQPAAGEAQSPAAGEPCAGSFGDRGHPADDESALHHAPSGTQDDVEPTPVAEQSDSTRRETIAVAGGDAEAADVGDERRNAGLQVADIRPDALEGDVDVLFGVGHGRLAHAVKTTAGRSG